MAGLWWVTGASGSQEAEHMFADEISGFYLSPSVVLLVPFLPALSTLQASRALTVDRPAYDLEDH